MKMCWREKLLIAISVLLPSACSGRPPTAAEVTGHWIADPASIRFLKPVATGVKCEITFNVDGTFVTPGLPDYLVMTSDRAVGGLVSGRGRWSVIEDQGHFSVQLNFNEMDGKLVQFQTLSLVININATNAKLFCWVGEPGGNRFEFQHVK